jgi:hypothetical protein
MLSQVESYQLHHVKKICLDQQDTFKYSLSSNPGFLEYRDFIFVCEYWLCSPILSACQSNIPTIAGQRIVKALTVR